MELKRDYKLKILDEKKIAAKSLSDPLANIAEKPINWVNECFSLCGIDENQVFGQAYIKLYPEDFIVEEIMPNFRVVSVDLNEEPHPEEINLEKPKTEADLIKQNMSTIEAAERMAENLGIEVSQIGYAGIKDSTAITAQKVSFNNVLPEKVKMLNVPNIILKNIHERKGIVEIGNLYGNRFTILLRTNKVDQGSLENKVKAINEKGFLNFYSLQRFGNRLNSHKIGGRILRAEYDDALKMLLVGDSPFERWEFRKIRKIAAESYSDWSKMKSLFLEYPYFFYYEIKACQTLENGGRPIDVFKAISDQTKMAVFAYFSYWFNKLLSKKAKEGNLSESLPLWRQDEVSQKLYREIVPEDQFNNLRFAHAGLEFLNLHRPQIIKTMIKPKIWHIAEVPMGYVFLFDLEKGAYATTLLSNFFELIQTKPVPQFINQQQIDIRKIFGYDPISKTIEKFPEAEGESTSRFEE